MSEFRTPLRIELMRDARGMPLRNRAGRQLWLTLCEFQYYSDIAGLITIEAGFVTDFASIPQWALSLLGDVAHLPSIPHDHGYNKATMSRKMADDVLYEACILTGVPKWKAKLIYAGVRLGGWVHYVSQPAPAPVA